MQRNCADKASNNSTALCDRWGQFYSQPASQKMQDEQQVPHHHSLRTSLLLTFGEGGLGLGGLGLGGFGEGGCGRMRSRGACTPPFWLTVTLSDAASTSCPAMHARLDQMR